MLVKCFHGEKVILGGEDTLIAALYLSAYNWNAINGKTPPGQLGEGGMSFFAVDIEKLYQWRADVEELKLDVGNGLRFDATGHARPLVRQWSMKKAKTWLDDIPVMKFISRDHFITFY